MFEALDMVALDAHPILVVKVIGTQVGKGLLGA